MTPVKCLIVITSMSLSVLDCVVLPRNMIRLKCRTPAAACLQTFLESLCINRRKFC